MRWVLFASLVTACGRLGFDAERAATDAPPGGDGPRDSAIDASIDSAVDAPPDGASVLALVQTTPVAPSAGGPVTAALPVASTAGTLLVASVATNDPTSLAFPAGWIVAVQATVSGGCASTIAYLPDNPGGITTVMFTVNAGIPMEAVVTEWSGASPTSPVDVTGIGGSSTPQTAQTVQTAASTSAAGDFGVVVFCEDNNTPTYTPGPGWTNFGSYSATSAYPSFTTDRREGLPLGVVSATETSSVGGKYQAAIATFKP